MKKLICSNCGKNRETGRRLCRDCYLEYKREYAKTRYKKHGRYTCINICLACKKEFKAHQKTQKLCPSCRKESLDTGFKYNQYPMTKRARCVHRVLAESLLNRNLTSQEIVHHIDWNPKNNEVINLIIMSRKQHVRLHCFLREQRIILKKAVNSKKVRCWEDVILEITLLWLKTANVKIIKLWEI